MQITIAGYGNIGHYVAESFGDQHEITLYDPPKGLGEEEDLRRADVVFIAVPTPSLPDGQCDTRAVEEVVSLAQPRQTIICHSTVSVGTTERLLQTYGKPLVYIPEYAGESPDHPYRHRENRNFFILGGYAPTVSLARALFQTVYGQSCRYFTVPPTVAEVVKYMENAFLAMKVSFCNEFYDLAQAVGVDYDLARQLWLQDRRINPSHTLVTPERGYGGKCLPKDMAAICATGRSAGSPLTLLEAAQLANVRHRNQGQSVPEEAASAADDTPEISAISRVSLAQR